MHANFLIGLLLFSCYLLIISSAHAQESTFNQYSTVDIQNLLNGKKQHVQQIESAWMESSMLSDACNSYGKQSPLYSTYSSQKSTSLKELSELKKALQYEIENLNQMLKDKKEKEDSDAKLIAEKKAKEEAERITKEKIAQAKLEAEKKAKEAEQQLSIGDLTTSSILTESESKRLVTEILKDVKSRPITLCYRASQGGFDPSDFHLKCDNKGATVTIVKSSSGAIFGGYLSVGWNAPIAGYVNDIKSFLFSIHGPNTKDRYTVFKNSGEYAAYSVKNYHPTFGNGHDIYISREHNHSYHNPSSFPCKEKECLEVRYNSYFTTIDYEVYTL